jgi:GNAT superfamily N-acetyltransferase
VISREANGTDHQPAAVTIRPARPDDLEALVAIQRAAELAALGHIFPPDQHAYPAQAVATRWRTALAAAEVHVLIAERGEQAVGLACVAPGWLQGLFVVPDAWGSGLADRLHDAAIMIVQAQGSSRCCLWVLEANHRARRFYARHGWRPDGRHQSAPFPPYPVELGYELDLDRPRARRLHSSCP